MRTSELASVIARDRAPGVPHENGLARFATWIGRVVLTMATLIFGAIGLRYIADPAGASARTGVTLNTALGYTTTRVGFGAFPLALALFSFACLLSRRRLFDGVRLIATLAATVIAVRVYSTIANGAEKESVVLFIPEGILLGLAISAAFMDRATRRHAESRRPSSATVSLQSE